MGQSSNDRISTLKMQFSREAEIDPLIRILKQDFFAAVTGPGGCGKSTLVYQYLYPLLTANQEKSEGNTPGIEGKAGKTWKIVSAMPGANPIRNLANALTQTGTNTLYQAGEKDEAFRDEVEKMLRTRTDALQKLYLDKAAVEVEPFNLLIVVDQLQDLARYLSFYQKVEGISTQPNRSLYGQSGDDLRFINQLLEACNSSQPIYLLLISDNSYQDYYTRHRGLLEKMNASRFAVNNADKQVVAQTLSNLSKQAPELAAFEKTLLSEYTGLVEKDNPDPYAMLKLKLSVFMALEEGKLPGMDRAIDYFIQEKVYNPMSKELKDLCMLMFKSLTGASSYGHVTRKPQSIESLLALCSRPPMITGSPLGGIQTIIKSFNSYNESFLILVGPQDLPNYTIVDIGSSAMADSWKKLKEWSSAESNDSEVFKTLYRDALLYFQSAKQDPEKAGEKLYSGANLLNALRWEEACMANLAWANLNLPAGADTTDPLPDITFEGRKLADLNKLELGKAFLKLSNQKYNDEMAKKDQALRALNRQRKWISVAGVVIFIFLIISGFNWYTVRMEKRNIVLLNYIRMLNYYDALDIPPGSQYAKLDSINAIMVKSNRINSEQRVLELLQDENILFLDKQNEPIKKIAIDALLNLNDLEKGVQNEHELMNDEDARKSLQADITAIYSRFEAITARDTEAVQQVPPLFSTLYAHILAASVDYKNDGMDASDPTDTIWRYAVINPNCIATNLHNGKDYAYGSINGQVYFKRIGTSLKELGTVNTPVTTLSFGQNGEELLVGTEAGQIFCFNRPAQATDTTTGKLVYQLPGAQPVQFIGFCDLNGMLLIKTANSIVFLQKNPANTGYQIKKSFSIPLKFSVYSSWSTDQNFFIVTSFNQSILYRVDPGNPNPDLWLQQECSIEHPGLTMYRAAVASRNIKGKSVIWLGLGSAAGRIWFGQIEKENLKPSIRYDEEAYFYSLRRLDAPIAAMAFSPGLPQLAVGSSGGLLTLWNIQDLISLPALQKAERGRVETIRISTFGQGITNLQYLSKDHLTVYENNYGWTVKTSLKALWDQLNCVYHNCPSQ